METQDINWLKCRAMDSVQNVSWDQSPRNKKKEIYVFTSILNQIEK